MTEIHKTKCPHCGMKIEVEPLFAPVSVLEEMDKMAKKIKELERELENERTRHII